MEKAFIFDMDGLLLDTETLTMEALRTVSRRHGERDDVDDFYPTTCGTTLPMAKLLYKAFFGEDYPFEERREEMRRYNREYIEQNGAPIKKGARELLEFLKAEGCKTALATSSTRTSAESQMEKARLLSFFDATVCGDEVTKSKPHPEIFLKAAQKLGADPKNCYVCEDSYLGVEAGAAAGMRVFMVPDMNPPREKEKALAYMICESLLEIKKHLE